MTASGLSISPKSAPAQRSRGHLLPTRHTALAKSPKTLCRDTLDMVSGNVRQPRFNVEALRSGILHLGCGAFHRAHQAVFTQRAIEADEREGLSWGITSASLRNPEVPTALAAQDGLYTVLEKGDEGTKAEIVGSVCEAVFAPADKPGLVARMADPDTRIVTLTVTAGGYTLEPSTGRLQAEHPDIQHDLVAARPRSVIGTLMRGLEAVRAAGHQPPIILSCDNLNANGDTVRRAVVDCAAIKDDKLASWIERSVQFPNTMVDRIVPTTSERDRSATNRAIGVDDAVPVVAEPFMQWVIEDFDGERPRWEVGGAQLVTDVGPWETAKLRLLNGTHMVLAYIGGLAGLRTMSEVARDPLLSAMALRFMLSEVVPTLPPGGPDPRAYTRQLLERWRNPAIEHNVVRIGQNGSVKLAARLLRPLRENLKAGRPAPCTILAIAGWIRWFALRDTSGTAVKLVDPLAKRLKALCENIGEDHPRLAAAFLGLEDIFGSQLPRHEEVVRELGRALSDLHLFDLRSVIGQRLN